MKRFILTLLSSFVFILHQVLIYFDIRISILDSFLDPLLFIPVSLGLTELIVKRFFQSDFRINLPTTILFTILTAVTFEWLIPMKDARFTADYLDILFYFFGGLLFACSSK